MTRQTPADLLAHASDGTTTLAELVKMPEVWVLIGIAVVGLLVFALAWLSDGQSGMLRGCNGSSLG